MGDSSVPALAAVDRLREEYGLTDLQARFVQEYPACGFNASEAARRAGYSENSARDIGHENLTKPKIQEALADYFDALNERMQVRAEDVLEEYRRLAFSSLRDVVSWGPGGVELRDSDDLSDAAAAAVREVELNEWHQEDGTVRRRAKVKMHRKEKALDKLGQFCGLWKDPDEARVQILQVFHRMSPDELARVAEMDDEELMELMADGDTWRLPGGDG